MKRRLFNLLIILFLFTIVVGCGCKKNEKIKKENKETTKTNQNEPVIKYKTLNNLKFGTASFYISDEKTYINTSIINDTKDNIEVKEFNILLKDSEDKILKTIPIKLGTVKAGETKEINEYVDGKYVNTEKIDYDIK